MDNKAAPSLQYIHDSREDIGRQIRASREKKRISIEELSGATGIRASTISKIEEGRFSVTADLLAKLGWYLGFSVCLKGKESNNTE